MTVLVGANGSGKTTLLRAIAGLARRSPGRVERRPGRVAYLPQDPGALLHRPSVLDEVRWTIDRAGTRRAAGAAARRVRDRRARRQAYPRDLSAGERQRAALAAILAGRPAIALLDEPTRGMDGAASDALRRVLDGLRADGCSVVVATHDLELAARIADRIVALEDGTVRDLGPAGGGPVRAHRGTRRRSERSTRAGRSRSRGCRDAPDPARPPRSSARSCSCGRSSGSGRRATLRPSRSRWPRPSASRRSSSAPGGSTRGVSRSSRP